MKKQIVILIICLVVALGLGGTLVFLLGYTPRENASSDTSLAGTTLSSKTPYDLDTLTVKNETGAYEIKNLGEEKYELQGLSDVALNMPMLQGAASSMCTVEPESTVAENPPNLGDYGLTEPRAEFSARYTDGSTFTLQLGNDAPGGGGVYAKTADSNTVYLFSSYIFSNLLKGRLDYIDTTVIAPPEAPVSEDGTPAAPVVPEKITLDGSCRPAPILIEKDEEATQSMQGYTMSVYRMIAPRMRDVDMGDAAGAIDALMTVSALSVAAYEPTQEQLEEFGLLEPYSRAVFSYRDYEENILSCTLSLSAPDTQGRAYLVREGVPLVYQVSARELPWYEIQENDLLSTLLLTPYIDEVAAVTVTTPEGETRFELEGEKENLVAKAGEKTLDADRFRTYYQSLIGLPAEEYTGDQPEEGARELLRITYEYRDAAHAPDIVTLIEGPPRRLFMTLGGAVECYVRESYYTTVLENSKNILTDDGVIKELY